MGMGIQSNIGELTCEIIESVQKDVYICLPTISRFDGKIFFAYENAYSSDAVKIKMNHISCVRERDVYLICVHEKYYSFQFSPFDSIRRRKKKCYRQTSE